jgi:hypothetical protein
MVEHLDYPTRPSIKEGSSYRKWHILPRFLTGMLPGQVVLLQGRTPVRKGGEASLLEKRSKFDFIDDLPYDTS